MCLAEGNTEIVRIIVAFLLSVLLSSAAVADDFRLTAKPDKCVTLRQGQTCYQSIRITFEAPTVNDYCLKVVGEPVALQCWSAVDSAEHRYSLASDSAVVFEVVNAEQSTLAIAQVVVSWVYKQSRRRSRWRLF